LLRHNSAIIADDCLTDWGSPEENKNALGSGGSVRKEEARMGARYDQEAGLQHITELEEGNGPSAQAEPQASGPPVSIEDEVFPSQSEQLASTGPGPLTESGSLEAPIAPQTENRIRPTRERRAPSHLDDYFCYNTQVTDPLLVSSPQ